MEAHRFFEAASPYVKPSALIKPSQYKERQNIEIPQINPIQAKFGSIFKNTTAQTCIPIIAPTKIIGATGGPNGVSIVVRMNEKAAIEYSV
jgi:hypothetical protein